MLGGLCDHHVLVGVGGIVPVATTVGRVKVCRRQEGSLVQWDWVGGVGLNSESVAQNGFFGAYFKQTQFDENLFWW